MSQVSEPHYHPEPGQHRAGELAPSGGHIHADQTLLSSQRGLWAVGISFLGLIATALFQAVVVAFSGSAGLLADTVHNFGDAATALPLGVAFLLSRRRANTRFTYGYHRAEDLAGLAVLAAILVSALVAGYGSYIKLVREEVPTHLNWAMGAAFLGFLGNEAVAVYRIRVGRQINSAALVADGHHARIDGITSLAALVGLGGVVVGFPIADPLAGFIITGAIVFILVKDAAPLVLARILDAVEPEIVGEIHKVGLGVAGVEGVYHIRARWQGHSLGVELCVAVNPSLTVGEAHQISEMVYHELIHEIPGLGHAIVHIDPIESQRSLHHTLTAHHFQEHALPHHQAD